MSLEYEPSSEPLHIGPEWHCALTRVDLADYSQVDTLCAVQIRQLESGEAPVVAPRLKEIGISLPNDQRLHRILHIQKDMLPYALC